jgi:hypothetical protein
VLPDEYTWLWDAYDTIRQALTKAIQPLYEYNQTFSQFETEQKLNPDKYVSGLDNVEEGQEPVDAEWLRNDIFRHRQLEEELKERIPEEVYVSIFEINIKDIRNGYVGKYQTIVEKEIKLIANRAMEKNYDISTQFAKIQDKILTQPKNIEELTEIKKYISDIGVVIEKLKIEIDGCMRIYDICSEFNYEFSGGENDNKW